MRRTNRGLERDRAQLEKGGYPQPLRINFLLEEKKLEMEIKRAAKQGNKEACKVLAKQLVNLRKQKTRSYAAGAKMSSMQGIFLKSSKFYLLAVFSANENYAHKHENGAKYGEYDKDNVENERQNGPSEGREDHAGKIERCFSLENGCFRNLRSRT